MDILQYERRWMYKQNTEEFFMGVRFFIESVVQNNQLSSRREMRCPCSKCKNWKWQQTQIVEFHLYDKGFVKDYFLWSWHGEQYPDDFFPDAPPSEFHTQRRNLPDIGTSSAPQTHSDTYSHNSPVGGFRFEDMMHNMGEASAVEQQSEEEPNEEAARTYNLLREGNQPAYEGCTSETQLSIALKLLQAKVDYGLSEAAFNQVTHIIQGLLDRENKVPVNYSDTKKLVDELGLGYIRIDVCIDGCMIYYGDDETRTRCRLCGKSRYKKDRVDEDSRTYVRIAKSQMFYLPIKPRISRLFSTPSIASEME